MSGAYDLRHPQVMAIEDIHRNIAPQCRSNTFITPGCFA
jgi:hypothetical protein